MVAVSDDCHVRLWLLLRRSFQYIPLQHRLQCKDTQILEFLKTNTAMRFAFFWWGLLLGLILIVVHFLYVAAVASSFRGGDQRPYLENEADAICAAGNVLGLHSF
jgi:hypothetical protein